MSLEGTKSILANTSDSIYTHLHPISDNRYNPISNPLASSSSVKTGIKMRIKEQIPLSPVPVSSNCHIFLLLSIRHRESLATGFVRISAPRKPSFRTVIATALFPGDREEFNSQLRYPPLFPPGRGRSQWTRARSCGLGVSGSIIFFLRNQGSHLLRCGLNFCHDRSLFFGIAHFLPGEKDPISLRDEL